MMTLVAILGWMLFTFAVVIGLALDLVGLFGNWVILAALATVWALTGFEHFGVWALLGLVALAGLGEVVEFLAAGYGASRFGGSKGGVVAALVGCVIGGVVGTPWFPILGTLVGACLGAFIGATAYEFLSGNRSAHEALWTGLGATLGKVGGMLAKLLVGLVMLAVAALSF